MDPAEPTQEILERIVRFRSWLKEKGASLNDAVYLKPDQAGLSVFAKQDIPTDTIIATCPFSLAVTLESAEKPLQVLCKLTQDAQCTLSERQRICTYIALHWILSPAEDENDTECPGLGLLRHWPYVDILPKTSALRTPLYFTSEELELFKGTNVYAASIEQKSKWEEEWKEVVAAISSAGAEAIAEKFTWEKYLAAATYLSSRAFPSTLLSSTPSLVAKESSYPILLPGIDALNHARGQPVTWQVSSTIGNDGDAIAAAGDATVITPDAVPELCVQLILNTSSAAGQELFNNYGPKPNSSLMLGYGFSIADNPDDTIILKLGTQAASSTNVKAQAKSGSGKGGHEIGRGAKGADALWEEAREHVAANFVNDEDEVGDEGEDEEVGRLTKDLQLNLETADILSYMISAHLHRLPDLTHANSDFEEENGNVRREVKVMWLHYISGQSEILQELLAWVEDKREKALEKAREHGIDIVEEADDDD